MLKKGESISLAVSVLVLVIILCPLSSLKVLYYAMTTANRTVGVTARRAKWCKIIRCSKNHTISNFQ